MTGQAGEREHDITFPKADLVNLAYGRCEGYEVIENVVTDVGRWSVHHRLVFKYDGLFYESRYSEGATESQFEEPYEYSADEVEPGRIKVQQVVPVEVTVTKYVSPSGGHNAHPTGAADGEAS